MLKMEENSTGKLIRQYRKANRLSQEELGALTGMATGTIAKYERGLRDPKTGDLMKIASALKVLPGDLLPFDDEPTAGQEVRDPIEDTIKWREAEAAFLQSQEAFLEQTSSLDSGLLTNKILGELNSLNQKGLWAVYQYAHDLFKLRDYRN